MMKKNISLREMIMLGLLIIIVAYYFGVYQPLTAEMDAIELERTAVQSDIEIETISLTAKRDMERAIEEALKLDPNPQELPLYNNANSMILELNAILSAANSYNIDFNDGDLSSRVMRRDINIAYSTSSYESAVAIAEQLKQSGLQFLLSDLSITDHSSLTDSEFDVAIGMACFEYVGVNSSEDAA